MKLQNLIERWREGRRKLTELDDRAHEGVQSVLTPDRQYRFIKWFEQACQDVWDWVAEPWTGQEIALAIIVVGLWMWVSWLLWKPQILAWLGREVTFASVFGQLSFFLLPGIVLAFILAVKWWYNRNF